MIKKKKILLSMCLGSLCLAMPLTSIGVLGIGNFNSKATTIDLTGAYSTPVSLTNSSFGGISGTYSSNDVSGWTRILKNGTTKNMIIDVVKGWSSKSTYNTDTFYLPSTMTTPGQDGTDNKILMISSATSKGQVDGFGKEGYRSSAISLTANSYYSFQVSLKTDSFNSANEFASIYLTGLEDEDSNEINISFEQKSADEWTTYYFFVATGDDDQSVTLDLWLGSEASSSYGVAFFDTVEVWKYSENLFYESLYNDHSTFDGTIYTDNATTKSIVINSAMGIDDITLAGSDLNLDFEKAIDSTKLTDWAITEDSQSSTDSHAEIINITSKEIFENTTGFDYPGMNYGYNNEQSLVLWANDNASSITAETKSLNIKSHGLYKVSMYVKTGLTSGSFYIKCAEQEDIKTNFPYLATTSFDYELKTGSSSAITSSGTSERNGYQLVNFYIQGHNRYDTNVKIQLAIQDAIGYVVVDDIKIEYISSADFQTSNNVVFSVSNETASGQSINNGNFNFTTNAEASLTYPLAPSGWTIEQDSSALENTIASGVVNTYSNYFATYATDYSTTWGNVANPADQLNAPVASSNVNNVFMFWNKYDSYQSTQSSTFSIESGKYYEFSLDVKTFADTSALGIQFIDEDGIILYSDMNVTSPSNAWSKYKSYFWTGDSSHNVYAKIFFGSSDNKISGYAFIDNVELTESTEALYTASNNKMDLSNFLLNLDPTESISSEISSSTAFTGTMETGSNARGGIIVGKDNTEFFYGPELKALDADTELNNNVLVISTRKTGTYTLTAKAKLNVTSGSYYSLTFKLLTDITDKETLPKTDGEGNTINYNYGVKVGLTGFDTITNLSQNGAWDTYTIYFKATSTTTTQFFFSLVADSDVTIGNAFLTDIVWGTSDEATYTGISENTNYQKTIFTSEATASSEEENEGDDTTTNTNDNPSNFNWLLIPSIIFGIAMIVGIIGWALRKIKIKKVEVVRQQEYDRKITLNKDIVSAEAEKIKASEVKTLQKEEKLIKEQLETLEKEHRESIEEARIKNNGKITKEVERMFKSYTSKKRKLNDQLQAIRETIATTNSPEYLLALERKVVSDSNKVKELNLKEDDENKD